MSTSSEKAARASRLCSKCSIVKKCPTSGEILMGNVRISRLKNNQVYKLRRQVGVIRQKDLFLPNRSAYENVEYVLSACEIPREEWDKRILDAFTTVGMWNFREASYI